MSEDHQFKYEVWEWRIEEGLTAIAVTVGIRLSYKQAKAVASKVPIGCVRMIME